MKVKANSNKYRISVKITIIFTCAIIMAIIGLSLYFSNAFAEEETERATNSPTMTATLYNTDSYSAGTGTTLTEEGVTIEGWKYDTSKYLQIDTNVPDDGNTYEVVVELPQEMYIVGTELATQSGFQTPEFTKNEDIVINQNYSYPVQKYSGTAKYKMKEKGTSGTIQLEVRYDKTLWDKRDGSPITKEGVCPIKIVFNKIDNNVSTQVSESKVSKVTSSGSSSWYQYEMLGAGNKSSFGSIKVSKDEGVYVRVYFSTSSQMYDYSYWDNFSIKIQCPKYSVNGETYYLKPNINNISYYSITSEIKEVDTTRLDSEGILIINFKKVILYLGSSLFTVNFYKPNEEVFNGTENTITFKDGNIGLDLLGKNGIEHSGAKNVSIYNIVYEKDTEEKVSCLSSDKSVAISNRPEKIVSFLGGWRIANSGTGDSSEKELLYEFDVENTNNIKVTTINMFADTLQEYIDIEYTLVDDNGNNVYFDTNGNITDSSTGGASCFWKYSIKNPHYNKSSINNLYITLTRSVLNESHRKYYFKSIKYNLKTIKAGAKLYFNSAESSSNGAGNFYGYVSENIKSCNSKITIHSLEKTEIKDLERNVKTSSAEKNYPSYGIDSISVNKKSIEAGDNFVVNGSVFVIGYPYGDCNWMSEISIGVILPEDMNINEQSITAKSNVGIQLNEYTISSKLIDNNKKLWVIKFPKEFYIGYYNENLRTSKQWV